ncbi:hypothetical protein Acor_84700 [Acrocarpospora corrugata]|uniref:Uncharacterized protein n=1 Tax=Acrocarpospora corrugata TaxID=35763 RepID=A0A5M3WH14_9ACTN|nr:hypothetical protein [Acrocarpospora corrugata]GES06401.1 hypothetical protein Acor_84700 [Acrocarpospora corrugata]
MKAADLDTLGLRHTMMAAAPGAVAGAFIGPATSQIFGLGLGGLATIGALFGGAAGILVGVIARDLLRHSTHHAEHTEHRASWTTTLAAAFLIGGALLSAVFLELARREAIGLDGLLVLALLPLVAILIVSLAALAVGILRRRATARWTAVVVSVCACAAASSRLLAELVPQLRAPDWAAMAQIPVWRMSVIQPALAIMIFIVVAGLLLSPAARRDFQ